MIVISHDDLKVSIFNMDDEGKREEGGRGSYLVSFQSLVDARLNSNGSSWPSDLTINKTSKKL